MTARRRPSTQFWRRSPTISTCCSTWAAPRLAAKHYDRALRAFEVALKLQPDHVDSMVELAEVNAALHDYPRAIFVLARARRLAPGRPEMVPGARPRRPNGEYYGDAAIAYDEYLRLRPGDDTARRDRALICGYTGTRQAEGLKDLAWYIRKAPRRSAGTMTWRNSPGAIVPRRPSIGWRRRCAWRRSWRRHTSTWRGFSTASAARPKRFPTSEGNRNLATRFPRARSTGRCLISLDRPADAEKVLRRAIALSPDDPEVVMHLGRALMELGREEEGRELLARFQKIRPPRVRGPWTQPA